MKAMPDILSDIYDCKDEVGDSTIARGRGTVKNPYLRIYGGGTLSVIKLLEDKYFEQGFLPRFHFVLDFDLKNRQFKKIAKSNPYLLKEYEKMSKNLQKIGKLTVKKLLYEDVPQEFEDFQDYCNDRLLEHYRRGDHITAPYYSRLPWHALKIAAILYVADLATGEGTEYEANPLPSQYIMLGMYFMRLYEQEYLQLIFRYKSSAPAGKFDTQERKLSHVESLLKLSKGVITYTQLLRDSKMDSDKFESVLTTFMESETIGQTVIDKTVLKKEDIPLTKDGKFPFAGRPPTRLIWHVDIFKSKKEAIEFWINENPRKKEKYISSNNT